MLELPISSLVPILSSCNSGAVTRISWHQLGIKIQTHTDNRTSPLAGVTKGLQLAHQLKEQVNLYTNCLSKVHFTFVEL